MAEKWAFPKAVDPKNLSAKALAAVKSRTDWVAQPKFDGCCMVVQVIRNGKDLIVNKQSAIGTEVKSCDHLDAAFRHLGPGTYVGEVWAPNEPFQVVSGWFRSKTTQRMLGCRLFDGYRKDDAQMGWVDRMSLIRNFLYDSSHSDYVSVIHWMGFTSWADTERIARDYQESRLGSWDGAILRNPNALYTPGRSKGDIVKVKPLHDFDLLVTGVDKAIGGKTGRDTCALVLRWKMGKEHRVATGLTHEQQENPEQFINKIVRVQCMGFTVDGNMREPRFIDVREDKTEADY